jgi:hypothetical protein
MVTLGDVVLEREKLSREEVMDALALILQRADELGDIVEGLIEELASIRED